MKVLIYARCSTSESRQNVEVQLKELRRYCDAYGWEYDEIYEYGSGFKGDQPKLEGILEDIRLKRYQVLLVYSLDRFSRQHPKKTNAILDQIVYDYGCRFISLQESIDSQKEMVWHVIRPMFTYFANIFSQNLSEKVRNGIRNKKEKGTYSGGRPKKEVDHKKLMDIKGTGLSIRKATETYNQGLPRNKQISKTMMARLLL